MNSHARPYDRRRFLSQAGASAFGLLAAPAIAKAAPATSALGGRAFGTDWRVSLPNAVGADGWKQAIEGVLAAVDQSMSPWRADSELTRFNRSSAGTHAVSGDLARVAGAALDLAALTDGIFDPTIGPAVARWGFGPISGDGEFGPGGLHIEGARIAKHGDGITLDLCGIAKGYAIDRVSDLLVKGGSRHHVIDIGGELLAQGHHPAGRAWRVAVEDPRSGKYEPVATIAIGDRAIATSGTKANGYDFGQVRYSHIIDPRTGAPIRGDLLSVSVLDRTAMQADAWATACMAAGDRGGVALARRYSLDALFLFADGSGLRREMTGGFDASML